MSVALEFNYSHERDKCGTFSIGSCVGDFFQSAFVPGTASRRQHLFPIVSWRLTVNCGRMMPFSRCFISRVQKGQHKVQSGTLALSMEDGLWLEFDESTVSSFDSCPEETGACWNELFSLKRSVEFCMRCRAGCTEHLSEEHVGCVEEADTI